jgi:hypothetical protein
MNEKIRCGGSYCESCKKCISPPRLRKNFQPEWWTICDECGPDVVRITYRPLEGIETDFKVRYDDIPRIINMLVDAYNEKKNPLAYHPLFMINDENGEKNDKER